MKLPANLSQELNNQVTHEFESAYIYMGMEAYFLERNLKGFANFFKVQGLEEQLHSRKFVDFLAERGEPVRYKALQEPSARYTSIKEVFEAALKHEQFISGRIELLMNLAKETKDHASEIMLQWFVTEQVEEESSMQDILDKLALIGESGPGLMMLDAELGNREFTAE
ncbi:MAG TPA: ferritin [bacterium]|nr:ferritin [bacterium]